jgi:hypothetical protein
MNQPNREDLIKRLKRLSKQMIKLGTDMDFGEFSRMSRRGRLIALIGNDSLNWVDGMKGKNK